MKEKNEQKYLGRLFKTFQSLPPGKQSYYLVEMEKLFQGKYELRHIKEPGFSKDHKFRGRPKGALNILKNHKSNSSTKRDPSGFEHELPKKKRGWPKKLGKIKKVVEEEDDEVCNVFLSLLDFFCSLVLIILDLNNFTGI